MQIAAGANSITVFTGVVGAAAYYLKVSITEEVTASVTASLKASTAPQLELLRKQVDSSQKSQLASLEQLRKQVDSSVQFSQSSQLSAQNSLQFTQNSQQFIEGFAVLALVLAVSVIVFTLSQQRPK
jgi:hypothetical protein